MSCFKPTLYPCGKCADCGAAKSSDWSCRLAHELTDHEEASFITLTYRIDNIDVCKFDAQTFIRQLRVDLSPKKIRFYLVSEYGEKTNRPHYHAIIFGHDFSKDDGATQIRKGLFTSPLLNHAWKKGHTSSGTVTPASIRYVANYVLDRFTERDYVDPDSNDSRPLARTFHLMSRNPGIGANWIDRHNPDVYQDDTIYSDGFSRRPPAYYDHRTFGYLPESLALLRKDRYNRRIAALRKDPLKHYDNNYSDYHRKAEQKIRAARRGLKPGSKL